MISKENLTEHRGRTDLKEYQLCQYESGFEVLLVSTKHLVKKQKCENPLSAVGLCVGVGSFSDPQEAEGIAHFLEHMLFMGSERYPDENEYDSYVTSHGGSCNAMTEGKNIYILKSTRIVCSDYFNISIFQYSLFVYL